MATINGTAGNDTLTGDAIDSSGNGGDDVIHGLAGNDTIVGHDGNDQLFGDDGNDVFVVQINHSNATGTTHSSYDGGAGFDTLDLSSDHNSPVLIQEVDPTTFSLDVTIEGSLNLPGDWGHLAIQSIKSVEQIVLGTGDATIDLPDFTVGTRIDARNTDHGTGNFFTTGHGDDTILGGNDADTVIYNGGNDTATLGGGNNNFVVQALSGASDHSVVSADPASFSTLSISETSDPALVDLAAGTATVGSATFSLSGFENVVLEGSTHVLTALGDDAANFLFGDRDLPGDLILSGRGGNDQIIAGLGNDQLDGGDGNDLVRGNGGNDTVHGGTGDDQIEGGAGNNNLNGDDGNDWINGGGNDPDHIGAFPVLVSSGADTITGGAGADHIWGNDQTANAGQADGADSINAGDGNDYVNGNAGADTIDGGAGNDRLRGGQGDDQIFGGDGNDIVQGDAGNDTLHGGAGYDVLTGGPGADTFAFSVYGPLSLSEASFDSAGHTDVITDFEDGVDKIAVGFTPAAVLTGTAATFSAAETAAQAMFDNHAGDHEVGAMQVGADTYLFFSGTGGSDIYAAVKLAGIQATLIDTGDFV